MPRLIIIDPSIRISDQEGLDVIQRVWKDQGCVESGENSARQAELRETGQAPNQQKLRETGQAPNQQKLRETGQAPNQQKLRETGQAPNQQEVRLFRAPLFDEWPSKSELRAADVIAVLGSVASVNQSLEWLERLQELLWDALQRPSLACIGICFGHQLINKLFGGRIDFHSPDRQQNTGIESTLFSPNRLGTSTRYSVIVAHSEHIVETAPGFEVIARRANSPRQGDDPLRSKPASTSIDAILHQTRPILGLQFHPEARLGFAQRAGIVAPQQAVTEGTQGRASFNEAFADGEQVLDCFFRYALQY